MTIRFAQASDSPEIVRVIKAVYDEYSFTWDPAEYHADLYDLDSHYFRHGHPFWIAELNGRAVGTVALEFFPALPPSEAGTILHEGKVRVAGADCSLERLYVHPDARRMGLGRALTQTVLDEARARGCQRMELWSDKRFGPAHALYGAYGAEVVGERICDDPDVSPEWGLRIELG